MPSFSNFHPHIHLPHRSHHYSHVHNHDAFQNIEPARVAELRDEAGRWVSYLNNLRPSGREQGAIANEVRHTVMGLHANAGSIHQSLNTIINAHEMVDLIVEQFGRVAWDEDFLRSNVSKVYGNVRECSQSIHTMRANLQVLMTQLEKLPKESFGERRRNKRGTTLKRASFVFKALSVIFAGIALIGLCTGVGAPVSAAAGAAAALAAAAGEICKTLDEGSSTAEPDLYANFAGLRDAVASHAVPILRTLDALEASLYGYERGVKHQMGRHYINHIDSSNQALLILEPDDDDVDESSRLLNLVEMNLDRFFKQAQPWNNGPVGYDVRSLSGVTLA